MRDSWVVVLPESHLVTPFQIASSVSNAAGDGDVSELLEHWEELARLILHDFQVRLLAEMEKATPSGKRPKPNTVMQSIRESLDAVLVGGLEALHVEATR